MRTELKRVVRKYLKQINNYYKELEEDFLIFYEGYNSNHELKRIIKTYINNNSYEQIKQDLLKYRADDFYKYVINVVNEIDKTYKQMYYDEMEYFENDEYYEYYYIPGEEEYYNSCYDYE